MGCKRINLTEVKKKLESAYKRDRDETSIMEKLEDNFGRDLSKYYGEPTKVNSLISKLKKLNKQCS